MFFFICSSIISYTAIIFSFNFFILILTSKIDKEEKKSKALVGTKIKG